MRTRRSMVTRTNFEKRKSREKQNILLRIKEQKNAGAIVEMDIDITPAKIVF
jgi:hypothetical protein